MRITEQEIIEAIKKYVSKSKICRALNMTNNGASFKKIESIIQKYNIDISHFNNKGNKPIKFKKIEKICSICNKSFITQLGLKNEKYFCSRKCANTDRKHTQETKNKISLSLKGKKITYNNKIKSIKIVKFINKQCEFCNKEFTINSIKKNRFCSQSCSSKNNWKSGYYNHINFSEIQNNLYKNGTQKVGGGKTKWYEYNGIKVQGTYEFRTCLILDKMLEYGKIYKWEYTNDRIPYLDINNKNSMYLIDFKVYNNENEFYYLEIKGFIKENDLLKWESVKDLGYKIDIWFLNDIQNKEIELNIIESKPTRVGTSC